ncbi:KR-domain-containing protein [Bimuria novae-zelandiae CBS 107.79]|uniref:KR-domain-containing protein n=1 Tax=Bimuria novae-zelandiae CBS 107.79 TaxID=1447943 RepID=A0A6A5VQC6_9PLEO|nr:KR-domain-containing protein [Bimuria novae-zelandiae CBS 107.79]
MTIGLRGRVDVQNFGLLHLEAFRKNATFSSFDLNVIMDKQPDLCAQQVKLLGPNSSANDPRNRLVKIVSDMLLQGRIQPLITKVFDVSDLDKALLYFSKGAHIGKIAMQYDRGQSVVKTVVPARQGSFDCNATYILVGGLGGLGRSLITWMAGRGARHIAVISRSGTNTSVKTAFIEHAAL